MTRSTSILILLSVIASGQAQSINPRDQDFWNGKFRDPTTQFIRQPSRLLVEAIKGRTPGRAVDLGMGEGRNTIFIGQQGWEVTGVDISDVGVAQAKQRAEQLHVKIATVIEDLDHYDLGTDKWDLITLFYVHAWYQDARPSSTEKLIAALKPGGLLVIEGFAGNQKLLFQSNELLRDFAGLTILRYEDARDEAEWAPGRQSHIIRLVAEKAK